ncbi:hypothetical protein SAG0136_04840 [Streptococcus agalactiae LMG 14747]|uniref:Uncharacterized protein n=1 Tax=Streptococcus agalactiae LMG 14747 TaxID=1154860 RepID=V6Z123_STRAG|nr:hypothetical protein SAG0136_04840 [Streptococcus agalactiae LMG 14747]
MLKLYFDNNAVRRHSIEQWLFSHNISFQSYAIDDLTQTDLLRLFTKTQDCFSFLKRTSWRYKLDNQTTIKSFIAMILSDKKKYLEFPLLETDTDVLSNVLVDDLGQFLPREQKEHERRALLRKANEISLGRIFWDNVAFYRSKTNIRYLALYQNIFNLTHTVETTTIDFNRFCTRLKGYRNSYLLPPENWIEAIADIFEIDVDELFQEKIQKYLLPR